MYVCVCAGVCAKVFMSQAKCNSQNTDRSWALGTRKNKPRGVSVCVFANFDIFCQPDICLVGGGGEEQACFFLRPLFFFASDFAEEGSERVLHEFRPGDRYAVGVAVVVEVVVNVKPKVISAPPPTLKGCDRMDGRRGSFHYGDTRDGRVLSEMTNANYKME